MKPLPPPDVPGTTEAERFDNAVRQMFRVPKDAVLRTEDRTKTRNHRKRAKAKKPAA